MEISLHSNQKHLVLSYYLQILKDVIMSPRLPFDKLYYIDLYCGDGECEIKRTHEKYDAPIIQSILKEAKEGKLRVSCFLNDIDKTKIDLIKNKTKEFNNFVGGIFCEDANLCCEKILPNIPKDQISLFFLDPYNHKQLKWETIKKISEHKDDYIKKDGTSQVRRPELIINCMTYTMAGSYMAKDFKSINESLGTDKWLNLIEKYKGERINAPVEQAFLVTFIKQLEKLDYKVPTPIRILNTYPSNTIYYLIFATNEKGYDIIEKKVIPSLQKRIGEIRKENEKKLEIAKAREKGDGDITSYFPN